MPRPRDTSHAVIARVGNSLLFWIDGEFSGDDPELVANVRRAAATHLSVGLTEEGPVLIADDTVALNATAALLAARPGRVEILSAPQAVLDLYPQGPEPDAEVQVIDGVVQRPYLSPYASAAEREQAALMEDPRVKLVTA